MSQETHAGNWIGFRQPVGREFRRREGEPVQATLGTNPGKVWEEAEFWIALSFEIDPDGSRGIRKFFESTEKPGTPVTLDEYYSDIFANSVPGLPEAAAREQLDPLAYMRRYGAFEVPYGGQRRHEAEAVDDAPGVTLDDGVRRSGFPTPSRKLEIFSATLRDWGFADHALPGYIRSHIHWRKLDPRMGEMVLLPTFRLPTLVHTRSGNAKWLQEISHTNPLWMHPEDGERLGLGDGDLARVTTRIGHFVVRVWSTEGIHPGVVGCSHQTGRWRLHKESGGHRQASSRVKVERKDGTFRFRQVEGAGPYASDDPDTGRIWWREVGVNQNLTFPVQPDPVSGMHCWHQKVRVAPAHPGDQYGDIFVDTAKSADVYHEWLKRVRPAPGPDNLRRPLWLKRPLRPTDEAFKL
jgi:anaerobic selenocysteine-containing dehydrogenase